MGRNFTLLACVGIVCATYVLVHAEPGEEKPVAEKTAAKIPDLASKVPGNTKVAIVDVAYLFKNCDQFKARMEEMKVDVEAAEAKVKKRQEEMKEQMEKMKLVPPDSPQYRSMENDLLVLQGALNLDVSTQKRDFMAVEGKVYFAVSNAIDEIVAECCRQHGIQMVLRVNKDPIDASDRNDILRGINKPLVYFEKSMDITAEVLARLNARQINFDGS